jgi:hypothetical protein
MKPLKNGTIPVHIPTALVVGDQVVITERVEEANGWAEQWNTAMDRYVGGNGIVVRAEPTQGFQVRTSDQQQFWYPSCALQLTARLKTPLLTRRGLPVTSNSEMAGAPLETRLVLRTPAKKRVRVGAGPWDKAPCPHLRWHLMGFFREKLALVKSNNVAEVEVTCTKCKATMTLQAK